MNDQEIKDLLNTDQSVPQASEKEWGTILNKIERTQKSTWSLFVPSFAVLLFIVLGSYQGHNYYQSQQDKALVEFLIDSGEYFEEQEPMYAWID